MSKLPPSSPPGSLASSIEVLSNGDANCDVRSDCTQIDTAAECFADTRAQEMDWSDNGLPIARDSQPGCFLASGTRVGFNSNLTSTGVWSNCC